MASAADGALLVGSAESWAIGNAQTNYLFGNTGNNYIDGAGGGDVMQGGGGNDVYRLRLFELNGDAISDFGTGDLIQFQGYNAATSTVTALGGNLYRVGDSSNGAAEVFGISNGFALTAANYTFL